MSHTHVSAHSHTNIHTHTIESTRLNTYARRCVVWGFVVVFVRSENTLTYSHMHTCRCARDQCEMFNSDWGECGEIAATEEAHRQTAWTASATSAPLRFGDWADRQAGTLCAASESCTFCGCRGARNLIKLCVFVREGRVCMELQKYVFWSYVRRQNSRGDGVVQ